MTKRKPKNPIPCKACGHDMSRSHVKNMTVRCNVCKTVHEVIIKWAKT